MFSGENVAMVIAPIVALDAEPPGGTAHHRRGMAGGRFALRLLTVPGVTGRILTGSSREGPDCDPASMQPL
jgi:hypothetical protein